MALFMCCGGLHIALITPLLDIHHGCPTGVGMQDNHNSGAPMMSIKQGSNESNTKATTTHEKCHSQGLKSQVGPATTIKICAANRRK